MVEQNNIGQRQNQTIPRVVQISTTGVDWPDCHFFLRSLLSVFLVISFKGDSCNGSAMKTAGILSAPKEDLSFA